MLRGKLDEADRDAALARDHRLDPLDDLADRDLVVEAVVEELSVKTGAVRDARRDLQARGGAGDDDLEPAGDRARGRDATGPPTSSGLHFFNPAPVMELVEVVSTVATAAEVRATAHRRCASGWASTPSTCGDRAGFIVNALLFPYLNDAVKMLEAHYATADDIDTAMKVGCGYPMGPFELLDVVGLDVALAIQRTLYLEFREPGFAPAPLLEHLVTAGYLGRKSRPRLPRLRLSPADGASQPPRASGGPRGRRLGEGVRARRGAPRRRLGRAPAQRVASTKPYRCPGCDQEIRPATPHVVAWPAGRARGRRSDRRHWHTACWEAATGARRTANAAADEAGGG